MHLVKLKTFRLPITELYLGNAYLNAINYS